nr:MAG TPA: hypothetical protein [Caudoviricetes sp.]
MLIFPSVMISLTHLHSHRSIFFYRCYSSLLTLIGAMTLQILH